MVGKEKMRRKSGQADIVTLTHSAFRFFFAFFIPLRVLLISLVPRQPRADGCDLTGTGTPVSPNLTHEQLLLQFRALQSLFNV